MMGKKIPKEQTKLVETPSIHEIVNKMVDTKKDRHRNGTEWISVRHRDSPILRSHIALPKEEYDVLAWAVAWNTCYLMYERRKRVYAYAITRPPMSRTWEQTRAGELGIDECYRYIQQMIGEGLQGEIYKNPIVRRRKSLGKLLGTAKLWSLELSRYDYKASKNVLNEKLLSPLEEGKEDPYDRSYNEYWLYEFGKGDIRVFSEECPKTNVSLSGVRNVLGSAISSEEFNTEEFKESVRIAFKNMKDRWDRTRYHIVEMNTDKEVKDALRRMAMLEQL